MECVFIKLNAGCEELNGTSVVYVNINEIQLFTEYKGSGKFKSSLKISGVDEPILVSQSVDEIVSLVRDLYER